jgi:hypothetical protein
LFIACNLATKGTFENKGFTSETPKVQKSNRPKVLILEILILGSKKITTFA